MGAHSAGRRGTLPARLHEERFVAEETELVEGDDGARALRGVIWGWDPDPSDTTAFEEFMFLLRSNDGMRAVHDRHAFGVFSQAQWREALASVGFGVAVTIRLIDGDPYPSFVCKRTQFEAVEVTKHNSRASHPRELPTLVRSKCGKTQAPPPRPG